MTLPIGDWQFWVVTLLVLAVVLTAGRSVLPRSKRKKGATRVSLTIDRHAPGQTPNDDDPPACH